MTNLEARILELKICLEGGQCFLEGVQTSKIGESSPLGDALIFSREKFKRALELCTLIENEMGRK